LYKTFRELLTTSPLGSPSSKHVLTLASGTVVAQLIPVLISPLLTRLFTPEDFGIYMLYLSVVNFLIVVGTGRYELAVILPREEEDAVNVAGLTLLITLCVSVAVFFAAASFSEPIARLMGAPAIGKWLILVPVSLLLTGIFRVMNYWNTRRKKFRLLAGGRIAQSISAGGTNILTGLLGLGAGGLILGSLMGLGAVDTTLSFPDLRRFSRLRRQLSMKKIKAMARRYLDFPKINMFQALIDMLQTSGVVFVISSFFGGTILGLYALTLRVLKAPLTFIGTSIGQVFYQKASEIYNRGGNLKSYVKKTMIALAVVGILPFLILFVFSPYIFVLVFGKSWQESGHYAQILAPWLYINFIYSPLSQLPLLVDKQKQNFVVGFFYNLLILIILIASAVLFNSIVLGFFLLSGVMSVYLLGALKWLIKISGNPQTRRTIEH